MRLLLVERDGRLAQLIAGGLRRAGFSVDVRPSCGDEAVSAQAASYGLILLDVGAPGLDGAELLARLRKQAPGVPVLIITARGDLADGVGALEAAADGYLMKPFDMAELLARIEALLRRPSGAFA